MSDNGNELDMIYAVGNGTLVRVWQMADALLDELMVSNLRCMPSLTSQPEVDAAVTEFEFKSPVARTLAVILSWEKPKVPIEALMPTFDGDNQ